MAARKKATVIEVMEVLHNADKLSPALDQLFEALTISRPDQGDLIVHRKTLKESVEAFAKLVDPKRGAAYAARLHAPGGTISWRPTHAGGPVAPFVRVRLDRYVEQLDISPPDEPSPGGRKYSDHRLRLEYLPDRVILWTDKLSTDIED
jgi:hypothetical protein